MTAIKCKIKKGDRVIVINGSDKGKVGSVIKVFPKFSSLLVQGIRIVKRHMKPTQSSVGGIIEKETKIHISNVAILSSNNTPTKIGYKTLDDGSKIRIAKKTGETV